MCRNMAVSTHRPEKEVFTEFARKSSHCIEERLAINCTKAKRRLALPANICSMGMPITITYNFDRPGFTTGPQVPVCPDWTQTPFNARVGVYLASGAASFSVEYCLDDVNSGVAPRWFTDSNAWAMANCKRRHKLHEPGSIRPAQPQRLERNG